MLIFSNLGVAFSIKIISIVHWIFNTESIFLTTDDQDRHGYGEEKCETGNRKPETGNLKLEK